MQPIKQQEFEKLSVLTPKTIEEMKNLFSVPPYTVVQIYHEIIKVLSVRWL